MHTFLIIYQWTMYALMLGSTGTIVVVLFLKEAHEEAQHAERHPARRRVPMIRYLRPIPNP